MEIVLLSQAEEDLNYWKRKANSCRQFRLHCGRNLP